jgi:DNA (cytosine-5)-methyltransferase 1
MNYDWKLKETVFEKNKGKVFSCFSGGGGSTLGYNLSGFDVIGCNDIDKKMMDIYVNNHNPKHVYLEPLQEFKKRKDLPSDLYDLDILDGSPPCFLGDELIYTNNGYVMIKDIKRGDTVLTHDNTFHRVKNIMKKNTNSYYQLNTYGTLPVNVTPEHPFYVKVINENDVLSVNNPTWEMVKDLNIIKNKNTVLKKYFIGVSINQNACVPNYTVDLDFYNHKLWYIIGCYIGYGKLKLYKENNKYHNRFIILSVKKSENVKIKNILQELNFTFSITEKKTKDEFKIDSKDLYNFLLQFNINDKINYLTNDILDLPVHLLKHFIDGVLYSRGSYEEKLSRWEINTINKKLICGIQQCIYKVYNQPVQITVSNRYKLKSQLYNNINPLYCLKFIKGYNKSRMGFFHDNHIWVPFKSKVLIKKEATVYNLTVENNESYTVNNLTCHNCSTFSISGNREKDWGKERVFKEGQSKQVLDTLFFDFIDLVDKLRPKVVIAENVKGMLQGNAIKYVRKIITDFEKIGYYTRYWLLDSSTMGVPQKRERVFFIGLRSDLAGQFLYNVDFFNTEPRLDLNFNQSPIPFSDVKTSGMDRPLNGVALKLWESRIKGDLDLEHVSRRNGRPNYMFNHKLIYSHKVSNTITANDNCCLFDEPRYRNYDELCKIGTFPIDYNFGKIKPQYVIGMSVPPLMIYNVVNEIYKQWISKF